MGGLGQIRTKWSRILQSCTCAFASACTSEKHEGRCMSHSSAPWRSMIEVIIPHPSAPRVLVLADGGHWYLPRAAIDGIWAVDVGQICCELRRTLGIATSVLRLASERSDDEQRQVVMTYVLENRDLSWQPPAHGRWIARAELYELAQPEQRALLDAELAEVESGVIPELRTPWCRVGWLDTATAWIAAQLAAHGTPLVGEVEQVTNWGLSCVLRGHTVAGAVYFKATATLPLFVNEPVIMAGLARRYPEQSPMPLSLDPKRRWMLLPDVGQPLGQDSPLAARQELLRRFGAIQRDCAMAVDELLALGCHDRRL